MGMKSPGTMTVVCKHCGKMNEKAPAQYVVICPACQRATSYFVQPGARKG